MEIKTIINKIKETPFFIQSINTILLRIIGVITLFGFTLFLTHNYSPKIIGQYDFIRTFLLVLGTISLLGTEQSILYFAGLMKSNGSFKELKSIYLKKTALIFISSIIPLIILLLIGDKIINNFFNDRSLYLLLLKATSCLFFFCLTLLNTEAFRALDKSYTAELYRNTLKYLSVIIGAVYLFYVHKEQFLVESFLLGFILLAILSSFKVNAIFNKKINNEKDSELISQYTHKEIFLKSYPMAISGMAIFLLMSFDVMFLKKFYGNEIVAYYATAIKLITILAMIINSVSITTSTKVAEYFYLKERNELMKIISRSSRLIFLLTLPMIVVLFFFPSTILLVFGAKYVIASQPLIILTLGQGICSLFGPVPIYLNMTGRQRVFQNILVMAVVINFLLNSFLIKLYGMNGAAISYSTSMIFWNLTAAIYIYKKDGIKIFIN
jgi:O-antigen/teichoic acid export membrane protein